MNAVLDPSKRSSIVPVFSKPKADFLEIPYGLAAYRGLSLHDTRLVDKVIRRFKLPRHRAAKETLVTMQENDKRRWLEIERLRLASCSSKPTEAEQPECSTMLRQKLDKIIQLLEEKHQGGTIETNVDDVESEMPEYLHRSLDSVRSEHHSHTTTYHVTINQPEKVLIEGRD